jgi:hypothetical protein
MKKLKRFKYFGEELPDSPGVFQSLPRSLQEIDIVCNHPQWVDLKGLLETLAAPKRFPELVVVPDIKLLCLYPRYIDMDEVEASRQVAYSALLSSGLTYSKTVHDDDIGGYWSFWLTDWENVRDEFEDEDEDEDFEGNWIPLEV